MSDTQHKGGQDGDKATVTLPATVEKIIPAIGPNKPEQAQIAVDGASDLYREIRVENTLEDGAGNVVSLKVGAQVEVTIEADSSATKPKKLGEARKASGALHAEDGKNTIN
jgi:hypothetical protein